MVVCLGWTEGKGGELAQGLEETIGWNVLGEAWGSGVIAYKSEKAWESISARWH